MTGRLSTMFTAVKEAVFGHWVLRYLAYLAAGLALLLFWLAFGEAEITFVYSDF